MWKNKGVQLQQSVSENFKLEIEDWISECLSNKPIQSSLVTE